MDKSLLKELVAAGAVRAVTLVGVPGGFVMTVATEAGDRTLSAQRGHSRVFKQLNSAADFLRKLGVVRFCVDCADWSDTGFVYQPLRRK